MSHFGLIPFYRGAASSPGSSAGLRAAAREFLAQAATHEGGRATQGRQTGQARQYAQPGARPAARGKLADWVVTDGHGTTPAGPPFDVGLEWRPPGNPPVRKRVKLPHMPRVGTSIADAFSARSDFALPPSTPLEVPCGTSATVQPGQRYSVGGIVSQNGSNFPITVQGAPCPPKAKPVSIPGETLIASLFKKIPSAGASTSGVPSRRVIAGALGLGDVSDGGIDGEVVQAGPFDSTVRLDNGKFVRVRPPQPLGKRIHVTRLMVVQDPLPGTPVLRSFWDERPSTRAMISAFKSSPTSSLGLRAAATEYLARRRAVGLASRDAGLASPIGYAQMAHQANQGQNFQLSSGGGVFSSGRGSGIFGGGSSRGRLRGLDAGDLGPYAAGINSRLDDVLAGAASLGTVYADLAGVGLSVGSGSATVSLFTGQAQQEYVSYLLDKLAEAIQAELAGHAAGDISDDEHAWLKVREIRLQNYVGAQGAASWQETAPFRRAISIAGALTGQEPQSGDDARTKNQVQDFLDKLFAALKKYALYVGGASLATGVAVAYAYGRGRRSNPRRRVTHCPVHRARSR